MNHPSSENNSEASLTRSEINERQVATLDGPLVMRNAAFYANSTCPSTPRNHDFTFINRSNEKSITVSRIDELLNYDSDYLYDIQSADKLQIVHELAFHEILTYVERSASLRIKEWGLKLEVIQNIKNKFSRPQTSAPIVKNRLFGMPLFMIQAQNGNGCPFPKFIMDIMEYLKETAIDVDGIFRRCGSQKRIQEMREICDSLSCHDSLPEEFKTVNFINELSDLLKLYLRTLPQKLVPESITEIVTSAISANPPEKHLHIMKLMVLILPAFQKILLTI
uniref:Rho-GAP domain-containing protein n=1 Tax=Panagrolaimus superbus TaxID=310955 RepID=A0A914XZ63_9BILA